MALHRGMERQMAYARCRRKLFMSCNKFSMYETHWVAHLVMIMYTEGCKDMVTLLLFYLAVIWECGVLPVGNAFFRQLFRDNLDVVQSITGGPRTTQYRLQQERTEGRCDAFMVHAL